MNLLKDVNVVYGHAPVANASNTDVTTVVVDTAGWGGVMCIQPITDSANTGKVEMTARQSAANGSGQAALAGGSASYTATAGDSGNSKMLVVDVVRPQKRYIDFRLVTSVANMALGDAIIILYNPAKKPTVQTSDVLAGTLVVSPAEA